MTCKSQSIYTLDISKLSKKSYTNKLAATMDEELTTEELMDLRGYSSSPYGRQGGSQENTTFRKSAETGG